MDSRPPPRDERPAGAIVIEEGRGDSIRVTSETAATGKHSLKFTDAPGLQYPFDPHLFYAPHFRHGRASLSFDIRLGAGGGRGTRMARRRQSVPCRAVAADRRRRETLRPAASISSIFPPGNGSASRLPAIWGNESQGVYDLSVTLAGQPPRVFPRLPCGSAAFQRLEWLGFIAWPTRNPSSTSTTSVSVSCRDREQSSTIRRRPAEARLARCVARLRHVLDRRGGQVILALVTAAKCPSLAWVPPQFEHVPWEGFHFIDLIFPLFLFLIGVSIPYALSKRLARGDRLWQLYGHIFLVPSSSSRWA